MSFEKKYIGCWNKESEKAGKYLSSAAMIPGTFESTKDYDNCYNLYVFKDAEDPKVRRVVMREGSKFTDLENLTLKEFGTDKVYMGETFEVRANKYWEEGSRKPTFNLVIKQDFLQNLKQDDDSLPW